MGAGEVSNHPPPPPGFVLDGGAVPPPPPGFVLRRADTGPQAFATNKESTLSAGQPESTWHKAWSSVRDSFFGSPEQAAAEAEGAYTQPPPSRVMGAMVEGATTLGLGPAGLAGLGRAGAWAAENPRKVMAVVQAAPRLARGDFIGAARDAGLGLLEGEVIGRGLRAARGVAARAPRQRLVDAMKQEVGPALTYRLAPGIPDEIAAAAPEVQKAIEVSADAATNLRNAQALAAAGRTEEARALIDAARVKARAVSAAPTVAVTAPHPAPPEAPKVRRPDFVEDAVRAPEDPNAYTRGYPPGQRPNIGPREPLTPATPRAKAPEEPAKATQAELDAFARSISAPAPTKAARAAESRGRAVAAAHNDLMAMAKAAAKANPKIGGKIWFEVDAAGKPIRVLENGDKAGGVLRSGGRTTFVKNLWGSPEEMFRD